MAKEIINIGTTANDGTGDQLRTAFDKSNLNFTEIYTGAASVAKTTVPADLKGVDGDVAGMIAVDGTSIWVCHTTWTDGVADIWLTADIAGSDTHIADTTLHFTQGAISITESQISDINLNAVPALPHGVAGDLKGQLAIANGFLYVCIADYVDDLTVSWQRVAISAASAAAW